MKFEVEGRKGKVVVVSYPCVDYVEFRNIESA